MLREATETIRAMPKIMRLAGYLKRLAALDDCGARLRIIHKNESTDCDEKWTFDEHAEWDGLCDVIEPWEDALSPEEKKLLEPMTNFMACLCRGEDPEEHVKVTIELLPTGKYVKK